MATEIAKACKEVKEVMENARKTQKEALDNVTTLLRDQIKASDHIVGISWCQYTPGFNDGDPCEFSVMDVEVKLSEETEAKLFPRDDHGDLEHDEDDDGEYEGFRSINAIEHALERTVDILNNKEIKPIKDMVDDINRFNSLLYDVQDALETKWGSGTRIIVTKKGITTEDYDCGY